jgi:hypothetical protein
MTCASSHALSRDFKTPGFALASDTSSDTEYTGRLDRMFRF